MAINYGAPINMGGNQIIDFRIENLATAPATGKSGRLYYNSSTSIIALDTGAAWVPLASVAYVDNAVASGAPANGSITNAKLANMATARIKGRATSGAGAPEDLTAAQVRSMINVSDGATANAADDALRDRATHTGTQAWGTLTDTPTTVAGYGITDGISFGGTLTSADNMDNLTGNKWYLVSSGSTPTNMPTALSGVVKTLDGPGGTYIQEVIRIGGASTQGNTYIRTYAGSTWNDWEQMDVREIADVNGLQAALNGKANTDHTHTASEVTDFSTAVNTQIVAYWDSIAGTDANVDTIREVLDMVLANASGITNLIGRFNADFGNGTLTSYAITHGLNSLDVAVEIYEKSSGATVYCDVVRTNANVVTVGVSPAPASNALRIVVKK